MSDYTKLCEYLKKEEEKERDKQYLTFHTRWCDVARDCRNAIENLNEKMIALKDLNEGLKIREQETARNYELALEDIDKMQAENERLNKVLQNTLSAICNDCEEAFRCDNGEMLCDECCWNEYITREE